MLIQKDFTFDAAHFLTRYHGKCEVLHGHTYHISVVLEGEPDSEGMILDFAAFKKIVSDSILIKLDHRSLNDLFENPTTEIIAQWIFNTLSPLFKSERFALYEVKVSETETSHVIVRNKNA